MKKSVTKSLAVLLTLVLIVVSLPVAVLAEEPEHCHDEMCCPECEAAAAKAVTNCPAGGSHTFMSTPSCTFVDVNSTYHRVNESIYYICSKCGYSYHQLTGASYYAPHEFTKTGTVEDIFTSGTIDVYTCSVCKGVHYF